MPAYNISRGWHGLDTDWMSEGACASGNTPPEVYFGEAPEGNEQRHPTEAFFEELGRSATSKLVTLTARQVCEQLCPVRETCLDYALRSGIEDGIWGGYDGDQRAAMMRQARLSA